MAKKKSTKTTEAKTTGTKKKSTKPKAIKLVPGKAKKIKTRTGRVIDPVAWYLPLNLTIQDGRTFEMLLFDLIGLNFNYNWELVDVKCYPDTTEFDVHFPFCKTQSDEGNSRLAMQVQSTDECIVKRTSKKRKKEEVLAGSGKLTITIKPSGYVGSDQNTDLDARVTLIPSPS